MKRIRFALASVAVGAMLAACGGGGDGNQAPAVQYSALVVFGDSLSDVGTYATSGMLTTVESVTGKRYAGKYTVNGPNGKNWTELLAAQLLLPAPCAAVTGLASTNTALAEARTAHSGCYNYAQGGARVYEEVGPGNTKPPSSSALGQLTEPVVTQIQNHLTAVGGSFSGNELVTVMAGGNDLFMNLAAVKAGTKSVDEAKAAMGTAGGQLAAAVKSLVQEKGAKRVMVVGLADPTLTPDALSQPDDAKTLMTLLTAAFNTYLQQGLAGLDAKVLYVDAYTASRDQSAHPASYGLTNVTTAACSTTGNILNGSSLACNEANAVAGYNTYLFADGNHLTPFGYRLMAQLFTQKLVAKGWL